jgi:hypothetical protein
VSVPRDFLPSFHGVTVIDPSAGVELVSILSPIVGRTIEGGDRNAEFSTFRNRKTVDDFPVGVDSGVCQRKDVVFCCLKQKVVNKRDHDHKIRYTCLTINFNDGWVLSKCLLDNSIEVRKACKLFV